METVNCDVLIIGAGASGLTAAIMLKRKNVNLNIILAEKLSRVGKKLSVTGNGRCNISNKDQNISHYHGDTLSAKQILNNFTFDNLKDFFGSIGVLVYEFNSKKAYPYSLQASGVVDALRFEAERLNIKTLTNTEIKKTEFLKTGNTKSGKYTAFTSFGDEIKINSKYVIISCGGMAGGAQYGTDGSAYNLLNKIHTMQNPKPVIVQIKTENTVTRSLKGIKVTAKVTINNHSDTGEVLFCDYGLSGPPILQLSRYCKKNDIVSLDLMPEYSEKQITDFILKRNDLNLTGTDFFAGLLNKRVGFAILKSLNLQNKNTKYTLKEATLIAKTVKSFNFKYLDTTGFKNAQSTSGGFLLKEFTENLCSKKINNLYCTGEILNIDGDCGGYNLHWAFASAFAAANGILNKELYGKR